MSAVVLPDRSEGVRCTDPSHVSYSRSRRWDECAYRAHAQDEGLPESFGIEAAIGSAVDAAIGIALTSGTIDLEGLLDDAVSELDAPIPRTEDRAKAARLFDLWDREVRPVLPATWATQLELHFDLATPRGPLTAHVHLDWVGEDGRIIDWKTSRARLGVGRADESVQLTWYWLALREVYGHRAPSVELVGLIDTKSVPDDVVAGMVARGLPPQKAGPWVDWQRSVRTDAAADALIEEIARREEARRWSARTGIYPTTGRVGFGCAKCPAKPSCPSWAGYPKEDIMSVAEGAA